MLNITFDSWLLLHIWLFVKLYWTLKMMLKWFNVQCYFGNVRNTIIGMQLKVASLSLQVQNLYIQISVNSYIGPKQKLFMQQLILIYFLTLRDLLVLRWYDSEKFQESILRLLTKLVIGEIQTKILLLLCENFLTFLVLDILMKIIEPPAQYLYKRIT